MNDNANVNKNVKNNEIVKKKKMHKKNNNSLVNIRLVENCSKTTRINLQNIEEYILDHRKTHDKDDKNVKADKKEKEKNTNKIKKKKKSSNDINISSNKSSFIRNDYEIIHDMNDYDINTEQTVARPSFLDEKVSSSKNIVHISNYHNSRKNTKNEEVEDQCNKSMDCNRKANSYNIFTNIDGKFYL